jgi:hypothetical protein
MERAVQVMFDDGVPVCNGKVKLTKSLSQLQIPPTVRAILASRIDRLPPNDPLRKTYCRRSRCSGGNSPFALDKSVVGRSQKTN